jgi:N-acetylglucosamine kinase-like BadF-type ATPase
MRTFLGVDGGGTKTDFLLIDESGKVLSSQRAGPAYYLETGVDALQTMLVTGIRATLAHASICASELAFAFIGLPAYGEDSALLARLDQVASDALPAQAYRCANDMVCGWAGALAGRDGINIVAGTGSIAYGEFAGQTARAGGWGELFSDEGSAYWVAREALNLFSKMSDGRAQKTRLYDLTREHFRVRADLDVCAAVYGPPPLTRSQLAGLTPIVTRAARAGDTQAQRLFASAANELAAIVHAVRDQLPVPPLESLPVSWSGGMFQLGDLLLTPFQEALRKSKRRYDLAAPRLLPSAGAALYAARLAGSPLSPEAISELERTHGARIESDTGD